MKSSIEIKKEFTARFANVGIKLTSVKKSKTEGYDYDIKYLRCGEGWVGSDEKKTQMVDEANIQHWVSHLEEIESYA